MRRSRCNVIASAAAGLLLAAAAAGGCALPAAPGPTARDVIAVTGRGDVSVPPDTAVVRLGAEARGATLEDATRDVAARMTAILERVKALGVRDEDVSTVRYAVDPIQSPREPAAPGAPRIAGYRVSNLAQLRIRDVKGAARVVDAAVAAGANVVLGVSFTLQDRAAAEAAARERAVAAARTTATQLARAAGVALGPVLSIGEGTPVRPFDEIAVARTAVGPGPIEAGELTVAVTVEVRYAIER
jgi:hypothetical protein